MAIKELYFKHESAIGLKGVLESDVLQIEKLESQGYIEVTIDGVPVVHDKEPKVEDDKEPKVEEEEDLEDEEKPKRKSTRKSTRKSSK